MENVDPEFSSTNIEVFYGEVPLWPTRVIMKLFVCNDSMAAGDVMTKYVGQSPKHWQEILEPHMSTSFIHQGNSGPEIIMFLRETEISLLIKEGINVTWLLSDIANFNVNRDNAKLQADFVSYIVRSVLNSRSDIVMDNESSY